MRQISFFLIAVAALAFAAHAGEYSAGQGATSVEPAIEQSLSDLGVSTQDEPTERTEAPAFNAYVEDGVQGYNIYIIETEPNCDIYYRYQFDGGEWSDWMQYTDVLMFTEPGIYLVEAYAVAPGKTPSDMIAYQFVVVELIEQTLCPTISVSTIDGYQGKYVEITENEPGCYIYYRCKFDNGEWSDWMEYYDPIVFTEPGTYYIDAYAIIPGKTQSDVVEECFVVFEPEKTAAPMFNAFVEDGVQGYNLCILESEPGCDIYYRYLFDGGEWTDWMEYTDVLRFTEPGDYCVEAYAVAPGKTPSDVVAYEFTVVELIEQTLSPIIGTVDSYQGRYVEIIEDEPDCDIYYRRMFDDGEWSDWMQYFEPILFTEPGIYFVQAYAIAPGKTQSDVVSCSFEVYEPEQTEAPMFYGYVEDGVQGYGLQIINYWSECDIYYRYQFDGGEWTDWMEYTDVLMFTEPGIYRVEAYAVAPGKNPSDVIAYEFTVVAITQPGDVNGDGIIGIEDVTTLIDIILDNSTPTPECDVNQDGSVDIADVTDLIDYILTH